MHPLATLIDASGGRFDVIGYEVEALRVRAADGAEWTVDRRLVQEEGDTFRLAGRVNDPLAFARVEEKVVVGTETQARDVVRLRKRIDTVEDTVDLVLRQTSIEVERVPIGREVDEAPASRQEGDTTIYPVLEERLVVERRLVLVEEVRVRPVRTEERHEETISLRRERIEEERRPSEETPGANTGS